MANLLFQNEATSCLLDDACNPLSSSSSNNSESLSFDSLVLVKVLNKAKFPVLLAELPSSTEQYAVKIFPFRSNKKNQYFLNEVRFASLRHENVISIVHYECEREAIFQDCDQKISYTVMELAPHGDLCELLMSSKRFLLDDKLARTYFHQLIEGLEYLHSMGVAHLDLKPDNLLLGKNYGLKIADFDQAHLTTQTAIISKGTESYRAPELMKGTCQNPEAADIYSAGILLFILKSRGILPYSEKGKLRGTNFFELMVNYPRLFWEKHCELQRQKPSFFGNDFKSLFTSMVAYSPENRITIDQIKKSEWYNGPVFSQEELVNIMKKHVTS